MGKLEELRVQRVDGVDKPAIRKRWVVVKSDDATPVEKDYAGAAKAVVEALAKEQGVELSEDTVSVLRALVELLDMDVEFKSEAGKPEDPAEGDIDANGDVAKTFSEDEVEDLIAKALRAAGVNTETVVEKSEGEVGRIITRSRQTRTQDDLAGRQVEKKNGRPSFEGVIFGQ